MPEIPLADQHTSITLLAAVPTPPTLTFFDGKSVPFAFSISFEAGVGKVTLGDAVTWDDAARAFWNAVHDSAGQPIPFPEHWCHTTPAPVNSQDSNH